MFFIEKGILKKKKTSSFSSSPIERLEGKKKKKIVAPELITAAEANILTSNLEQKVYI